MYSTRIIQLLLVAISVWSCAHAFSADVVLEIQDAAALEKRQQTSSTGDSSTSSTALPSSSSSSTTQPPPTPTPTSSESSTTPSSSSSRNQQPSSTSSSSSSDRATSTSEDEPTQTETPVEETVVHTITTTNNDGVPTTFTTESKTTRTPGLSGGSNNGGDSGMAEGTRNTIIGVVVGVGGAFILGALGIVGWRIWGRKKQVEEQDNLMDNYNGRYSSMGMDKSDAGGSVPSNSTSGRNPFQQTLETYHAPTQVNPSSNF